MTTIQEPTGRWRKSSYSPDHSECVESACVSSGGRLIRDTKNRDGGVIAVSPGSFAALLDKAGRTAL